MDDLNQQPAVHDQQPIRQAVTTSAPGPVIPNLGNKPKLNISAEQARALLAINNLESSHGQQQKDTKLPIGLIITLVTLVALVIIASILVGSIKPQTVSNTSSSSSGQSNSSSSNTINNSPTGQTSNQINQDVDSCSNPLTAISSC